ncbi:hypothetical protein ACWEK5_44265 [Rhodococcus koreensis]
MRFTATINPPRIVLPGIGFASGSHHGRQLLQTNIFRPSARHDAEDRLRDMHLTAGCETSVQDFKRIQRMIIGGGLVPEAKKAL